MNFRLVSTTAKMIALLAVISLTSCKKDVTNINSDQTKATTLSDSSTTADNAYYDVLNTAFVGVADNGSVWGSTALHSGKTATLSTEELGTGSLGCAIYSFDNTTPGSYPKTLTLDFGTGCTSLDGISRSGKISYLFSDLILSPGATATVTFDHYKVNGYGIQGQYTITNNYSETSGISFITQVTNGIITYPDATNFHYTHNKTYTQTGGTNTPYDITDDVYSVYGTSSFTSSEGNSLVFTATANAPLIRAVACSNISKGVVTFVYNQSLTGSIDFGDGTCDKLATLTVGDQHAVINLR